MSGAKWITLAQALELALSEEQLRAAGLNGHIAARITYRYRPSEILPPEYWNGEFDLERSRMRRCDSLELDSDGNWRQGIGCWINGTVEIDLQSVRKYFGLDQQPTEPRREETRGTPATYDWEQAGLEILARIYRHEIPPPKKPGDAKRLYEEWFAAGGRDQYPDKTVLYEHAGKLLKALNDSGK